MPSGKAVDEKGARDVLRRLTTLPPKCDVQVHVITGTADSGFEYHRLVLERSLAGEFRAVCGEFAAPILTESPLRRYTAGENYSGGVLVGYLDPSNIPAIAQMRPHLENPLANPVLNPRQLGKKKVRLYVVSVKENASSWIHLLNETNARFRLEQHGILAAIFSDGVYSALEEEALLFTRDFDAVFDAKIILVIEQKPLQRALGILAAVQKQSKAILKAVTKSLAIQNYADFEAAVSSQLNMVPRLASIRERFKSDATYAAAMTMDNIVAFVRSNPQVDISIVSASGKPQIVFEPQPQKRWKILQLLDDDYLVSELTKQRYEVSSKSSLS